MITLVDGRNELYQWDTGRAVQADFECRQFHFQNKVYGRTVDVDAVENTAKIPDFMLQSSSCLTVFAYVGSDLDGYTKISRTFEVIKRNKPADYVFTPTEQKTIDDIESIANDAKRIAQSVRDEADAGAFKGDTGDRGPVGPIGETGPAGPVGERGPTGEQGPIGDRGPIGLTGDRGPIGPTGERGPIGETGPAGAVGPAGPQGVQGIQGEVGPRGPIGETGPAGPKGDTGAEGPQGVRGPTGPQGPVGKPFAIAKIYGSVAAMNADYENPKIAVGEFVLISTASVENPENSRLYVKGENAYEFLTDLSGAQGIQGPPGEKGNEGPRGATGPQGPKGDTGADGKAGPAGPAGAQGEQGPRGLQGVPGETGPAGPEGPAGAAGAAGAQGPAGHTPVKGVDYWTASDKQSIVQDAAAAVDLSGYLAKPAGTAEGQFAVFGADGSLRGVTLNNLDKEAR